MRIVTRRDLDAGAQASQITHAGFQFAVENPIQFQDWYKNSNYVALLSVSDEEELLALAEKLRQRDVRVSIFHEPDFGNQATSFAIEPCDIGRKLTSHLPLAFRELSPSSKKDPIVFHYNKAHNQDETIPPWIVKHKGQSHYVHHLDSKTGFSTKETPDNLHTKGSLKFKGDLKIIEEKDKTVALIT